MSWCWSNYRYFHIFGLHLCYSWEKLLHFLSVLLVCRLILFILKKRMSLPCCEINCRIVLVCFIVGILKYKLTWILYPCSYLLSNKHILFILGCCLSVSTFWRWRNINYFCISFTSQQLMYSYYMWHMLIVSCILYTSIKPNKKLFWYFYWI